jgi:2-(1,2-epoxy-1,2-dihydrophenyl)acetyl-CoA isomerase
MAEYEHVDVERTDGVGWITVDRPQAKNALDEPAASDLRDAVVELVEDDAVRCVALTGSGGTFCTGADLSVLNGDESDAARLEAIASRLHTAVRHLATASKPTVSAVGGVAAGGGFGLALCCDLVLVGEGARLEFAYPRIGLSADGGSTYFLPRLVGRRKAREILLRDEPIDAEEAVEMGLATEVVADDDLDERLREETARLAGGPTRAYAATKSLLEASYHNDLADQLDDEQATIARLTGTDDWGRGYEAFFGDEPAEFRGE